MYIDGKDGKLCAGPVWDFDYQTFPNPDGINSISREFGGSYASLSYDASSMSKWLCSNYSFDERWTGVTEPAHDDKPYMWYPLLLQHEEFKAAVKAQWLVSYPKLQQVVASIRAFAEKTVCLIHTTMPCGRCLTADELQSCRHMLSISVEMRK